MRKSINVPPPADFASFSPSELFKFYFQIGRWTEESFSDALQAFTRGKLVSTVTISKWKNRNVIPTRYSGAFLNLVESWTDPDLAKRWTMAFETVWALHSAGRTQSKSAGNAASFSDAVCAQHREWIAQLYFGKRPEERFSPSDIYVPLQISDTQAESSDPQDVEDLIDLLSNPQGHPSDNEWVFISGGPGAGKSMTALHLAQEFSERDLFPIYLRGSHLSSINIDITEPTQPIGDSFSAKSFLQHFRTSSFKMACLVLDGLDEISRRSQGSANALAQFIAELRNEQNACAAHNKSLRIIALGREAGVQFSANQLSLAKAKHFALRALDGSVRGQSDLLYSVQGQDLRPLWWEKYLSANGYVNDPSLPEFLTTEFDDFAEFGTDPLLTLSLCHLALEHHDDSVPEKLPHERVNELTYTSNKNELYKNILDRQARGVRHLLDSKRFKAVLQHIALAVWQGGDNANVSLKAVHDCIEDAEVKASFQTLSEISSPAETSPNLIITAFHYRMLQDEKEPDQGAIEFAHKAFGEYLVSTLLLDRFTQLISAFGNPDKLEQALKAWVDVSTKGSHGPSLANFCQKEAAIRFDTLLVLNWDVALDIIRNYNAGLHSNHLGMELISGIKNSSNLLLFIWSCLNLERQKRTGEHFCLPNGGPQFTVSDLKTIQRPNGLNFEIGSLNEPTLRDLTFLTQTLSALHLKYADMSQLSLSLGHIENLICEDTSFAMTHWSHVKVIAASFTKTKFQQAVFHHWRVMDSHFTQCLFQGSRFQGGHFSGCQIEETFFSQCHFADVEFIASEFENVVFDRCVFSQSVFSKENDTGPIFGAEFRHCTFMDMETSLKNIAAENISNSISEFETEKLRSFGESYSVKTTLDELL